MYFSPEPKEKKKDLYDFEYEYSALKNAILKEDKLIVIKGLRRTGKTSLMKVVYNELDCPKCFIDARIIEPKQKEIYNAIINGIRTGISSVYLDEKAKEMINSLKIEFLGVGISFKHEITNFFSNVDELLEKKKTKFVLFIDEVQRLKPARIDSILGYLFDNTKNIKLVLAGSEIGVLDEVLGEETESALYGRAKKVIEIQKLDREKARDFLKKGFKELEIEIKDHIIEKAIDDLDGVIGWLTLFGYYYRNEGESAIKKVKREGAKITAEEIRRFLSVRSSASKKYLTIMEGIITGLRWIEIKRLLEAKSNEKINDKTISKYLDELSRYGFIIEREKKYFISDPLLLEGVRLITKGE